MEYEGSQVLRQSGSTLMMLKEQPACSVTAEVSVIQEITSDVQAWARGTRERISNVFTKRG